MRTQLWRVGNFVEQRRRFITPLIFLLAAGLLVAHVRSTPIEDMGPDGHTYERLGNEAATGSGIFACGNFRHAYWSPTWVTTIALLYRVTGRDPEAIRYLLVCITLTTCFLIYLVARETAGYLGGVAAVCLFVFSSLIFRFTVYYQYEIPFAFLLFLSGFLLFFRLRGRAADRWGLPSNPSRLDILQFVASGIALGAATLTSARGFAMFFLLGACLYLHGRLRYVVRTLPALALGVLVVLGPWTARNRACFDEWIFATTNGGLNLFVGNNEYSTLGYRTPPPQVMLQAPRYESALYVQASLDYIKSHPWRTAGRAFAKLFKFWSPHYGDQLLIYSLFWVALIRLVKREKTALNPGVLWLVSMPFMFMLIHAAFYVQVRYVIPALPCIAVVAGAGSAGWSTKRNGAALSDASVIAHDH